MNPNYEEATMALNFNPEDMGASPPSERQVVKATTGMSLHKLEEQFERNAAVKLHEAENYVASALDRFRVFGKSSGSSKTKEEVKTPTGETTPTSRQVV